MLGDGKEKQAAYHLSLLYDNNPSLLCDQTQELLVPFQLGAKGHEYFTSFFLASPAPQDPKHKAAAFVAH